MPAQSHVDDVSQDSLKSSLLLSASNSWLQSLATETDIFAAAAPSSVSRDTACIGKHQREKEAGVDRQGIRPGTLLREVPVKMNSNIGSSDCIDKIHNNNISQKQNKPQNIKVHKPESDERHEKRAEEAAAPGRWFGPQGQFVTFRMDPPVADCGSKHQANIKKPFKLLNKINNSEFIQYDKIRMYNKNNEKTSHTQKKIR